MFKRNAAPLIGYIALTVLLSAGMAQGLSGSNTVDSGDIKNGQVKSADLASNAVSTTKVLNNSLSGGDIKDNSLTGADINEPSLDMSQTTLKSGQTETGFLAIAGRANGVGEAVGYGFTYPIRLESAVTATHFTGFGGDATCTGGYYSPTAPPGTICVYERTSSNVATKSFEAGNIPRDLGNFFIVTPTAAGTISFTGSWAVTAP